MSAVPERVPGKPVMVTGASSGIGLHLTERLAALGHRVFATARKRADLERLSAIEGVIPIEVDLRDPAAIERAAAAVAEHGLGLYGLVHNAGLGGLGFLTTWSEEELREIFQVNVFAPIQLTRACLPMLVTSRGRVVHIGSQGGSISMRYYGPYTMTKHALEALNVALGDELAPHGVPVSIVQPGGVVSAIGENAMPGILERFRRAGPPFEEEARAVLASIAEEEPAASEDEPESATNRKPSSPEIVAVAVLDALFASEPRARYLVGTRWEGGRVLRALLDRLLDANDCPTLRYSEDELIAMLRERAASRETTPRT